MYLKSTLLIIIIYLLLFINNYANSNTNDHLIVNPINNHKVILEGIDSIYSKQLYNLFQKEIKTLPDKITNIINLQCLETPTDKYFYGLKQEMVINASVNEIVKVLDDYAHYTELFDDLAKAKIIYSDADLTSVFYEQELPFFMANEKYVLNNYIEAKFPIEKKYLYKLKQADRMKFSDGFIKIKQISTNISYYLELDFMKSDLGILKNLPDSLLWKKFVDGAVMQDLELKYKTENPTWDYLKIKQKSEDALKTIDVKEIIKSRVTAETIF